MLSDANEYCSNMGKEIIVKNIESGALQHFPGGTVDVTFQCLSSGDSGLVRPEYQSAPDIVIESR